MTCFSDTSDSKIFDLILALDHGKIQEAKLPSIHSMKQWGVHDSFRETFTLWVVNRKETKARGSDHRGELRIGHG